MTDSTSIRALTFSHLNGFIFSKKQQDAQDVLLAILDGLHEDLNTVTSRKYVEQPDFDENSSLEINPEFIPEVEITFTDD